VLAKGLDVNAANRYQTIKAFQQALERATRPVVLSPAYPSANVGMNRSSASPAALSGSTKTSIRPRLNPFAITTKTIIATGLGAAIFTVLLMYVRIPSPVPNASFWPAYGLGAFFAVLFGPIAGTMIAFIGHAMADAIQYGTPWWSWVIASGVAGFIYGFGYMRIGVEEGTFMGKDRLTFNRIQVIGNAIAWIVVAPVLDIVIYKEPVNLVFTQGFIAAISNSVSVGFFGTLLLSLYASIRRQRISSIQTT
jgi:energy-coupling factor transport system substrate-specific component